MEIGEMTATFEKAIAVYGESLQKQVAIEEMAELTKEVCKDIRGKGNRKNILEEIVDVSIMLEQLQIMYGISSSEMLRAVESKVKRLEERLKGE